MTERRPFIWGQSARGQKEKGYWAHHREGERTVWSNVTALSARASTHPWRDGRAERNGASRHQQDLGIRKKISRERKQKRKRSICLHTL
jgi:hypothetical protein